MVTRVCTQCSAEFNKSPAAIARGEGRFCSNDCRKEYLRIHPRLGENAPVWKGGVHKENRAKKSRSYWRDNTEKARAHDAVKRALKAGKLQKGPCRYCQTTHFVQAHHEDYTKPLDVIWLCPACHSWYHTLERGTLAQPKPLNRAISREHQRQKREAAKLQP